MNRRTSLVIMAAGLGSRYGGGIKQIAPLGPSGEIMMDYAIYDALEAGFDKIVFIIRRDLESDFREVIGRRIERRAEVAYAFQELDDLPDGYKLPGDRVKPWGTGHAILAARDVIHEPFAVINADDYYGRSAYRMLHALLSDGAAFTGGEKIPVALSAFVLGNTLSDNGGVTRGILELDQEGHLAGIRETRNIIKTAAGAAGRFGGIDHPLAPDLLVSMNMWGFEASFIDELKGSFNRFLDGKGMQDAGAEFLLPDIVDGLIKEGRADVRVLKTDDIWFGVTYQEDRELVHEAFADLTAKGVYPSPLFSL